jgi:hypothetical protein
MSINVWITSINAHKYIIPVAARNEINNTIMKVFN